MDNINTGYMNINSVINSGRVDALREGLNLDKAGLELLREMSSGDTFRGEVVDIAGNTATISIGEDARITANIDTNVNLSVGQSVLFEVNTDSDNLVSLRTLFTNIANENIANNALTQANIPINATSLALVSTLMEEGMSIDKDSLALLYRNIVSYPEVQANEIIRMKQIGLELTSDNIARFDAVMNFESKISDSINTVINQIPLELAAKADTDLSAAIKMASDFIDASTEGKTEVSVSLGELGLSNENLLSEGNEEGVFAQGKEVPVKEVIVENEENQTANHQTVKNIISDIENDTLLSKGEIDSIKSNLSSVELVRL